MLRLRTSGNSVTEVLPAPAPTIEEEPQILTSKENYICSKSKKRRKSKLWLILKLILCFLASFYLFLPFWIHFCPWVRRQVILLSSLNSEFMWDLSSPASFGLSCAKHTYLNTAQGIRLGIWHIPPTFKEDSSLKEPICFKNSSKNWILKDEDEFNSERPVILYFHGTGFTRATTFRRDFYRILTDTSLNAHVVTFDYRGFGDSSPVKAQMVGILDDAEAVYLWLQARVTPRSRLILWGHSLGAAIAVQLTAKFAGTGVEPYAVVLESTFTNMLDAVYSFPFSALHRFWPGFDRYVARVAAFHPDTYIANDDKVHQAIASPLLILHAEDDNFLTVNHSRTLYQLSMEAYESSVRDANNKIRVFRPRYVEFEAALGYGHKYLSTDPRLPFIVRDFLKDIEKQSNIL